MKVVFIGGGAPRVLPIVRGVMASPGVLAGGEIVLFDLNAPRAEAMGRMIMRTPEYAGTRCRVTWNAPIEKALDGADAVQIGFAVGSPLASMRSHAASRSHGFLSSDQLSPTGAFLALTAGPTILGYARKMERLCPRAPLIIFANPVAVYSGLVSNHTRIRAFGVCGGFQNHMWDLTRLMGRDEECADYDVEVAGINHLSFILRGTFRGRDLFKVLGRRLGPGWKPPKIQIYLRDHIRWALRKLRRMLSDFGTLVFSTEGDGMAHLYYEECFERSGREARPATTAQMRASAREGGRRREEADRLFRARLDEDLSPAWWAEQDKKADRTFARTDHDATVRILKAFGGAGPQKVVASLPNGGAVAGFKDRTVLEYSMILDRGRVEPYGDLSVPDAFHGLITGLATHQTLLGDAIAAEDPRLLYQALYAYPVKQETRESRALFRDLIAIHGDEIPAVFQETRKFFN